MTIKYILFKSLMALPGDNVVTEIPAGAVVEGPATLGVTSVVEVTYSGQVMRVVALDLEDCGKIA